MVKNTARVDATQGGTVRGLPLATLNHISVLCRCLPSSLTFYTDVLGFVPIHRPGSLNFAGAWYVRSRQQRFKKNAAVATTFSDDTFVSFLCRLTNACHRLYNYGIGIHLLQAEDPESLPPKKTEINPKDNHISFQVCVREC
jgi:catechol 2,3-dioxygenase-like lactoylglutathione lyase family enzyme